MTEDDRRLAQVDLAALDAAVSTLAAQGLDRAKIARELGTTYWRVNKSVKRLGVSVARGAIGKPRKPGGDPDYHAMLDRRNARKAARKRDPLERKRQEILEAERRRIEGLPEPPQRTAPPVDSIWD